LNLLGIQINLESFIEPILTALQNTEPVFSPQLPPLTTLLNSVGSAFSVSYGFAVGFVGTLFSTILGFTFMLMAGIYLSLDGDKLYSFVLDKTPEAYRKEFNTLLKKIEHIWDSFFRGQVTLMVLIGVIVWLGGSLLGLPGAFALGIVAGLLEIIPNLGPVLSTIPALVVALLQGSNTLQVDNMTFMFIVLGFYVLVQQVENYFIVPRVLGQAVDLHPLVVLTGVLVGASIAGILGALLASPVLASSMTIVGYLYRKIRDLDPFPPKEDPDDEDHPPFEKQIQLLKQKFTKFLKRLRKLN
jgi:predicted PurR-regulated permease PerM